MADHKNSHDSSDSPESQGAVAPGYPAASSLSDLDVSEWEPAAVFRPVVLERAGEVDKTDGQR